MEHAECQIKTIIYYTYVPIVSRPEPFNTKANEFFFVHWIFIEFPVISEKAMKRNAFFKETATERNAWKLRSVSAGEKKPKAR